MIKWCHYKNTNLNQSKSKSIYIPVIIAQNYYIGAHITRCNSLKNKFTENKHMKKLVRIQVALILLQIASGFLLFWYGITFYSNYNILKIENRFTPNILIIDSLKTTSASSSESQSGYALGYINNEEKIYLQKRNTKKRNESIGDTILVWSIEGIRSVKKRKPNEKTFNRKKYYTSNRNIILFVFLPIIIVWFYERIITKKIKKLKSSDDS